MLLNILGRKIFLKNCYILVEFLIDFIEVKKNFC